MGGVGCARRAMGGEACEPRLGFPKDPVRRLGRGLAGGVGGGRRRIVLGVPIGERRGEGGVRPVIPIRSRAKRGQLALRNRAGHPAEDFKAPRGVRL